MSFAPLNSNKIRLNSTMLGVENVRAPPLPSPYCHQNARPPLLNPGGFTAPITHQPPPIYGFLSLCVDHPLPACYSCSSRVLFVLFTRADHPLPACCSSSWPGNTAEDSARKQPHYLKLLAVSRAYRRRQLTRSGYCTRQREACAREGDGAIQRPLQGALTVAMT